MAFPSSPQSIEANHINKKEDLFAAFRVTEDDEKEPRALARIRKHIIKPPSIYGHEDIKTAISLSLFHQEEAPRLPSNNS
jgi:DNA replication licensing factor MCM2